MIRTESSLLVVAADTHWPDTDKRTHSALMEFVLQNQISHFAFLGDQFHNNEIHLKFNSGKISLLAAQSLKQADDSFIGKVLNPLDSALGSKCQKLYLKGNHDDLEEQFAEMFPQVKGRIERQYTLGLDKRGWEWLPCGSIKRIGKLGLIHGETLSGKHHAEQALNTYCCNLIYGHFHTIQAAVKILPYDCQQKWGAWSMPCLANVNPDYCRNKPNSHTNGFGIIELYDCGFFNVHQIVTTKGRFAFGGKVYRG